MCNSYNGILMALLRNSKMVERSDKWQCYYLPMVFPRDRILTDDLIFEYQLPGVVQYCFDFFLLMHFFLPPGFNQCFSTNYGRRCFPKIPLTDDVTSTSSSSHLLSDRDPRSTKHIRSSSTSSVIWSPSTTSPFLTTWRQNIWSTTPFISN